MRYLDKIICKGRLFTDKRCLYQNKLFQISSNLRKTRCKVSAKKLRDGCMRLFKTDCLTRLLFDQSGYLKSSQKSRLVSVNSMTHQREKAIVPAQITDYSCNMCDRYPYYASSIFFINFVSLEFSSKMYLLLMVFFFTMIIYRMLYFAEILPHDFFIGISSIKVFFFFFFFLNAI